MKKFSKKALCIILSVVIALGSLVTASFAKDADGIVIKVSSDKKYYTKGEDIVLDVEVTNTTDEDMSDVDINMDCNWFNFDVEEGSSIKIKELKAGETKTIQFHAKYLRLDLFEFISVMYKRIFAWFCRTLWGANSETTRYSVRVDLIKRTFVFSADVGVVSGNNNNSLIQIDRSCFAHNEEKNTYSVYEEAKEIFGTLAKSSKAESITFEVKDAKGTLVDYGNIDVNSKWSTDEIGFVIGENTLTVTVTYEDGEKASDSITSDCYYNIFSDNLAIDTSKDSDEEGLTDYLENYIGSNPNKADTDGDGLSDHQEVVLVGTDPLISDTDGDGENDFNSDYDEDGLSNGYEIELGTNPTSNDSDGDNLYDNDEISQYKTDPQKEDSDNDGANDGWEIANGFNPLEYNDTFEVKAESGEVSEVSPVSVSVTTNINGEQASSLNVKPVGYSDNPLLSAAIPGYLGTAYDFSVNGEFSEATITFEYDTSLGTISETFQPRIYYFNEEDGTFEELENQTVTDGKVSATVSHFSKYILLNKVAFDKVWETEISPPLSGGETETNSLDVVFVIDYSYSMSWNDSTGLRKEVTKEFIEKLREEYDKAAVVSFIAAPTVLCDLTNDKETLHTAIDSIIDNNGYGTNAGTNGSAAINSALATLENSTASNKYIIFLTDGEDTYTSYSYDELTQKAKDNNIIIYSIGLGDADESLLTNISSKTGGKYYKATAGLDLNDIYEKIEAETIDLTADLNNDLIPDYYNDLIFSGEMVLSNGSDEFAKIDFNYDDDGNLCDDIDGDGLKNGEELCIVEDGNAVYLVMKSNPLMVHSDSDLIDDYDEVQNGTNPMMYQTSKSSTDYLKKDSNYMYESVVDDYENNWLFYADVEALAAIYGVWNKDELYRDLLIDYFANYGEATYIKNLETEATKKYLVESLSSVVSNIKKYWASPRGEISKICKLISQINGTADYETIRTIMFSSYSETVVEIFEMDSQLGTFSFTSYSVSKETTVLINLTNISKGIDKVSKGLSYAAYGLDVADTIAKFAKVSANMEAFDQNADILRIMANESTNDHARNAANAVLNSLAGSMGTEILKAVGADAILDIAANELIGFLAKKNVYVLAFVVIRDGLNLLTGIKTDIQQTYRMDLYSKLTDAITTLVNRVIIDDGSYVYIAEANITDFTRLMTNLAQVRILGEKMYCDWQEYDGVLGWFIDNSDTEEYVANKVENVKNAATNLGLTISSSL